jgi:hypothetical protein
MLDGEHIDKIKIDISDEGIDYWAAKMNCKASDLRSAVMCIGDDYKMVKLYLELNRLIEEE